jgi:hypothetical protein
LGGTGARSGRVWRERQQAESGEERQQGWFHGSLRAPRFVPQESPAGAAVKRPICFCRPRLVAPAFAPRNLISFRDRVSRIDSPWPACPASCSWSCSAPRSRCC